MPASFKVITTAALIACFGIGCGAGLSGCRSAQRADTERTTAEFGEVLAFTRYEARPPADEQPGADQITSVKIFAGGLIQSWTRAGTLRETQANPEQIRVFVDSVVAELRSSPRLGAPVCSGFDELRVYDARDGQVLWSDSGFLLSAKLLDQLRAFAA